MVMNRPQIRRDSRRTVRPALAGLQAALDFVQSNADPRPFLMQPIHARDGSTWVPAGPLERVADLQRDVRALLRAVIERREYEVDLSVRFGLKPHGRSVVVTRRSVGRPHDLRDAYVYRLIRLLEDAGVERLRVCQAPDRTREDGICGRFFLKVTQKKFCSARCQSRVYMRTKRERDKTEYAKLEGARHGQATRTRGR